MTFHGEIDLRGKRIHAGLRDGGSHRATVKQVLVRTICDAHPELGAEAQVLENPLRIRVDEIRLIAAVERARSIVLRAARSECVFGIVIEE